MYPPRFEHSPGEDPARGDFAQTTHLPGTTDPSWAIRALRVPEAWQRVPERGKDVVVAQPDTGFTRHGVLFPNPSPIDTTLDFDVLDEDDDATDPLVKRWWAMDNPGHGTATASVVVGGETTAVKGSAPARRSFPSGRSAA